MPRYAGASMDPMASPSTPDLAELVVAFAEALRSEDLPVTAEQAARLTRAIVTASPATTEELAFVARPVLVTSREQYPVFDRVFDMVFRGVVDTATSRGELPPVLARRRQAAPGSGAPPPRPPGPDERWPAGSESTSMTAGGERDPEATAARTVAVAFASREERLAQANFADLDQTEVDELARRLRGLRASLPLRRTPRRTRPGSTAGELDLRRTMAGSRRHGGELFETVRRDRRRRPRRLVVLLDISGSMKPYARAYLHWMHGASQAAGSTVEVFTFATRLTRLTRTFGDRDAA